MLFTLQGKRINVKVNDTVQWGREIIEVILKSVLLQNKIKTQEDVINRINKIDKHDISYVLERCFKPGIISTAFVGQGVETDKLNSILENSKDQIFIYNKY